MTEKSGTMSKNNNDTGLSETEKLFNEFIGDGVKTLTTVVLCYARIGPYNVRVSTTDPETWKSNEFYEILVLGPRGQKTNLSTSFDSIRDCYQYLANLASDLDIEPD